MFSCKSKNYEPIKEEILGYEYFPIKQGAYFIYDVLEIPYPSEPIRYQIKELIGDTIRLADEIRYKILRYRRTDPSVAWPEEPFMVWTAVNDGRNLIKTENNQSFIKLIFPIKDGKTWNGNIFNDLGPDNYQLVKVGAPYENFANTVTVIQNPNDSNLIEKDYRIEIFAKGFGLVYKQYDIYGYDQQQIGKYKIASGKRYIEKLIEYGNF